MAIRLFENSPLGRSYFFIFQSSHLFKGNRISGGIEDITNMTNLLLLDLSTNALTGGITDNLLDQTGLMWINIADNALTGIFLSRGHLTFLQGAFRMLYKHLTLPKSDSPTTILVVQHQAGAGKISERKNIQFMFSVPTGFIVPATVMDV